jgi:uncharacterized membrane protein
MLTAVTRHGLLLVGLLASALSAGFFYSYSISVMPGLSAADPQSAIRAMQGINREIRTPVFAFAFFGALVFPLAAALLAWLGRDRRVAALALSSTVVYAAGVLAVTFAVNVPLNDLLASASPTGDTAASIWANYERPWTTWNHVRAVAAIAAFGLLAAAAVLQFSPRRPGRSSSVQDDYEP